MPTILNATDAIVKINASAICGSDLHFYHMALGSEDEPYLYGHEAIGYVTEVGDAVQFMDVGDYVVIPDNVDDGHYNHQPGMPISFGVGSSMGGLQGTTFFLQTSEICLSLMAFIVAGYARVPFADNSLIPVPVDENTTLSTLHDFLFVSDIFTTAWTALDFAGFEPGDSVAVFGAGPVGLLSAYSAVLRGASRVYSVDRIQDRLDLAASVGAIPINFNQSDPVQQIMALEPNGVRRSVNCVGYEAENSTGQVDSSIVMRQMVNVTAARGGIGIVGVYSSGQADMDIGQAFGKAISVSGGVILPLQHAAELVQLISSGRASPGFIVSSTIGIEEAPTYYNRFDKRQETKVVIQFP